jgi:hypothetical protein
MKLPEQVTKFGLVGERKALALLCLGFYSTVFAVMGLIAMAQLPEWTACFFGLAGCYTLGFFAVAADWFWGRWFAVGLGYSGVTMAVMSLVATHEILMPMVVFGVMHALVSTCLLGEKMAARYEARDDWRKRWNLDDQGVIKIQRSVTRAATSLPSLIMWALAPRDGAALAVLAVATVGLAGLLRGRTWGVMALGLAGVGALSAALAAPHEYFYTTGVSSLDYSAYVAAHLCALVAGVLLVAAAAPFVRPIARHIAAR